MLTPCPQGMAQFYHCLTLLYTSMSASHLLQHYWLLSAVTKAVFSSAIREVYFKSNFSDDQYVNFMAGVTLPSFI